VERDQDPEAHRQSHQKDWRFWGLYVHVTKLETLRTAYEVAKKHNGAPGLDGVTFAAIEAAGVELFLAELRDALADGSEAGTMTTELA